jgi:hypothetical protein
MAGHEQTRRGRCETGWMGGGFGGVLALNERRPCTAGSPLFVEHRTNRPRDVATTDEDMMVMGLDGQMVLIPLSMCSHTIYPSLLSPNTLVTRRHSRFITRRNFF